MYLYNYAAYLQVLNMCSQLNSFVLVLYITERGEVVMHQNQAYETVTGTNHSNPVTKVPTAPCPAYGVVTVLAIHDTA